MSESATAINGEPLFEAFLNRHDDKSWREIIKTLLPSIHEVDRNATQIWFYFYPLALLRALQETKDIEALVIKLQLQGKYYLKDQIDTSHEFLYGHRFWPQVKAALIEHIASPAGSSSLDLVAQIKDVAGKAAKKANVDAALVTGVTAVAFMTLQQVGAAAFKASHESLRKLPKKSPEQVLRERARDDRQGVMSLFKPDKIYTVTFNENDPKAKFKLIKTQHVATAAASDKRDYHSRDQRCVVNEGPIPIECRSASCGTCWVGVLGGAEKLSDVGDLEGRRIKVFGYIDTDDPKPIIRLSCQAQGFGAASIVIPPWNGVFGEYLRKQSESQEEGEKEAHR